MASASPARPGALAGAADAKNQMAEILAPPRRRNDCCRLLHAAWPPRPRLNSKTSTSQSACVHHGGRGKAAGQHDPKIPFASVCRTWSRQAAGRRVRSPRPPKVPRRLWISHAGLTCRRFADECGHADPPAGLHSQPSDPSAPPRIVAARWSRRPPHPPTNCRCSQCREEPAAIAGEPEAAPGSRGTSAPVTGTANNFRP